MNIILVYIIEAIVTFLVIGILHYIFIKLFKKKFNPVTTIVFTFVLLMFIGFIVSPFVMRFPYPHYFYFSYIVLWVIFDFIRLNRSDIV